MQPPVRTSTDGLSVASGATHGSLVLGGLHALGAAAIGLFRLARRALSTGEADAPGALTQQIFVCGVQALPLVCVVAAGSGAAIVLQTGIMAPPPSGELGRMLVVVVLRELTPLVTAIVVTGHSAAMIATETQRRGASHVLGTIVSMLALTVYFGVVAILAGYLTSQLLTLRSFEAVKGGFQQELRWLDLPLFVVKGAGLGAIVGRCARSRPGASPGSPTEIAVWSRRAFTASLVGCMAYSGCATVVFYALVGPPAPP
jgi:phospholipid/cholesterol/gamma-HCH transport system permease protein